jgi:hypothetical protein
MASLSAKQSDKVYLMPAGLIPARNYVTPAVEEPADR